MRAYFFGNMYLSSIQQGIQAAHVVHELFISYPQNEMLWEWANTHKTMVLLNGGFSSNLRTILSTLRQQRTEYPYAAFQEEDDALDGALTCVGVILPEKFYMTASDIRDQKITLETLQSGCYYEKEWFFSKKQIEIVNLLLQHSLAH